MVIFGNECHTTFKNWKSQKEFYTKSVQLLKTPNIGISKYLCTNFTLFIFTTESTVYEFSTINKKIMNTKIFFDRRKIKKKIKNKDLEDFLEKPIIPQIIFAQKIP